MDNKDKNKVSGSAGGSMRERTTTTTQTTTTDITQKASFMGLPYDRWILLMGLLFALLLCLGFFVRCGANPVTPVATAVPPAPAATATAVKPAPTNTALPATAVPATAVPPTAVPPAATAVTAQLPKITLPKITLPALPFLAGAAGQFIEGTGDPNTKYTVYDGDKAIGTVISDATGKWKFELPKLNVGDHSIKLVPLGADGKEIAAGAASVVLSIKEAVATAVASLPKINLPKITLPALPFLAGAAGQFVEGTGDPNTKYTVYDGDKAIGTVTTDASGKWKFELPKLNAGDHSIKLVPLGADGKEIAAGAASVVLSIKEAVATAVASLPKINLPKITLPALPFLAGAAGQFIEGTGDPNTKYTVYDGDKAIGTVTTDASGKWKFELPKLNAGDHSIKLVPLGADGKEVPASAASVVLSIKEAVATAVAALPKVNLPKITLPATNSSVAASKPGSIEGTGDPNTKYTVYDGDKAIGTVTADASGKWKFDLPVLSAGDHSIKLVPMGADGKEVPASASSVVVKATADAAPAAAIPGVTPLKGDTVSQGGVMRGTGTPGSTVMIYEGDKMVGTAKVDAKGNWSWKVPLDFALGDHSFKVATQGADGKAGAFSAEYKFKVTGPVTLPVTGEAQTAPLMWVVVALLGVAALVFGARKAQTQAK